MLRYAPVGALELLSGFRAEHHTYDMHACNVWRTPVKRYHQDS